MSYHKGLGVEAYLEAFARLGSYNAVARELGVHAETVRRSIRAHAKREGTDPAILGAMSESGMEDLDALHSGWIKTEISRPGQEDPEFNAKLMLRLPTKRWSAPGKEP